MSANIFCVHIYIYMHMHIHIYICIHIYIFMFTHAHMCVRMCMYISCHLERRKPFSILVSSGYSSRLYVDPWVLGMKARSAERRLPRLGPSGKSERKLLGPPK